MKSWKSNKKKERKKIRDSCHSCIEQEEKAKGETTPETRLEMFLPEFEPDILG
jgi:hypothetical protein